MNEQRVRIIAGLGNPGDRYRQTRHNIGFMVADRVVERLGCGDPVAKFNGLAHDCRTEFGRVLILKPLTFMNRSGQSVGAAMRWFKSDLQDLLVIYDELDLPFGEIRIRPKGSPAGHNGLASVMDALGTQEIARMRVGIGRPPHGDTTSWVLSRFRPEEEADLPLVLNHASDAVLHLLEHGIEDSMGRFNGVNVLAREEA
jgi:peptidyl-tRNA hydrolase, PTH1 family